MNILKLNEHLTKPSDTYIILASIEPPLDDIVQASNLNNESSTVYVLHITDVTTHQQITQEISTIKRSAPESQFHILGFGSQSFNLTRLFITQEIAFNTYTISSPFITEDEINQLTKMNQTLSSPIPNFYMITGHDNEEFTTGQSFDFVKKVQDFCAIEIHILKGDDSIDYWLDNLNFAFQLINTKKPEN